MPFFDYESPALTAELQPLFNSNHREKSALEFLREEFSFVLHMAIFNQFHPDGKEASSLSLKAPLLH